VSDADTTVGDLRNRVRAFVADRDWEQFHNAKDLAGAIAIEAAELMELFLWMTPTQVVEVSVQMETRRRIEEELADVLILCLSLANRLDIDVTAALLAKLRANAEKYPEDQARGSAAKYTAYRR
jgi:NTP pyrophosphatase (non-canonical NTP hydrolase)